MKNATPPAGSAIAPELDYRVEQLLLDWWRYDSAYRGAPRGAKAAAFYGRGHTGRVHDTAAEILEEYVDHVKIEGVRGAVESLDRDHREAVEISMINITSPWVWRSNRLGKRLEALYAEAKAMLVPLLRRRHVEI